ncbi:hypothetical protein DF3PA_110002 [Candidatus Defluviicoccus seviourii]|uniref:Uncharacterized protein n=2 Tax=root TaxID=1 RepID=A0A564W9V8_9PROT|nr:hypothetical protein DF3PB_80040 [uncultured Defluviicoccus sp.]VUX45268.1 hypothetical protein DF3PA_110002 [Candidatus Defluviicoccus seviourii]
MISASPLSDIFRHSACALAVQRRRCEEVEALRVQPARDDALPADPLGHPAAAGGDGVATGWSKFGVNRPAFVANLLFLLASPRGFEPLLPP